MIVCTPVWAWSLSPPVRAWLKATRGSLRSAAFVTVSGDTRPHRIAQDMARTAQLAPVVVAGFSERDFQPDGAAAYADQLAKVIDALRLKESG